MRIIPFLPLLALVGVAGCGASGEHGAAAPAPAPAQPPAAATASPSQPATPEGPCSYLTLDELRLGLGISVEHTTSAPGTCSYEAGTGSHDAPTAQRYLHGHDGVLVAVRSGTFGKPAPTCQQLSIPGIASAGVVCEVAGSTTVAFALAGERVGELHIFVTPTPSLYIVDALARAAYRRMSAG
jgi:hypothetical protein